MVTSFSSPTKLALAPIQQQVVVRFNYNVCFSEGIFHPDNPLLAETVARGETQPQKAIAVIDEGLLSKWNRLLADINDYAGSYSDRLTLCGTPLVIPGGEAVKNDPSRVEEIYKAIETAGLCRHSYILAIGGGAVLDLVGYAAATAHRGIRLIRIPTTVLAQNDSGVGVKNSINAFGKKKFIGTFAPPYAVINDFNFLTTLEDRDWRSGMAEAVKVALIKDGEFFNWIEDRALALSDRDMESMQQLIYRCAQLHLDHIANSGDSFETGSSRPLDFGHWAAHKLEGLTDNQLRHGEAVAIGIALDSTYSYLAGLLERSAWERIIDLLRKLGFCLYVPELNEHLDDLDHPRCLFRGLDEFREHLGGRLTLTLLEAIGQGVEVFRVDRSLYVEAIGCLAALI
ncbi:MAG: 3-dehydroquinate synthase [Okeania sp. SIO2H7]|nr:3-dehydroquinate synthase [Okeania sp. SIO2H7]